MTSALVTPFADLRATAPLGWSAPAALAGAGTSTGSLGISATPGGSLLAGWVQGPPQEVMAGGRGPVRSRGVTARPHRSMRGTQEVRIAEGTLAAGFAQPVELSSGPSGSLSSLQVTLSAPDVGYAVWDEQPTTSLRLSVVCNGEVVISDRRLLRDAVPLALFPLVDGRAALVFDQYGHGDPLLEYAVLSATGAMGPVARIAHPGSRDTAATELSVNPRGELIASWVHDDGASPPGSSPTSPGFSAARLVVVVCKPALHCASFQRVRLGVIKPACINPAVAISPNGTTTVIAAASGWATGCDRPLGVWASVTPGSATSVQPMRLIQQEGDFPVAEPVGSAGTVMAFNSGLASSDSFAWSFLRAGGTSPVTASRLDEGGWWNTGQQPFAPSNNGWYVIAWTHANRHNNANLALRAAIGRDDHVAPPAVVVSARTHIAAYVAATDGSGNAIILFSGSTDTGNGASFPYTSGLYATVHHH